ncbi:MAG: YidH family protein [Microcoleaceae cyanobacterium]
MSLNMTVLKKTSERARDHLANERTYLAWMRTAIALTGFGVLIARLRYLVSPETPGTGNGWALGLLFALTGLLTVLFSTWHYFSVLRAIEKNAYKPAERWVILFSLTVVLLGVGVLYVLLTMPESAKPSVLNAY